MRIAGLLGAALAAMFVVGCNGGEGSQSDAKKRLRVGIVFDSGGRGDKSFNDSAWAGIERAQKEFDIDVKSIDSKAAKDYETNLAALAEQGMDLVFAVGVTQQQALDAVAPKHPNVKFALIDGELPHANVRNLQFREEQGSFLAGYAAGLASKSGKIGFVGGMNIPLIKKFEAGYVAGAKTANPSITVLPAKYTESWDDVSLGKAAAKVLFNAGADVVYHAAGRAGLGVIDAAREANRFAIGVDSDQDDVAPGRVLTSMIKHVDVAVYETIRDTNAGSFQGGSKVFDLASGGVGLSDFKHTKDVMGEENLKKLDQVKQQIISGEVAVPTTPEELQAYLAKVK